MQMESRRYRRLSYPLNSIHERDDARVLRKIEQEDARTENQTFAVPGEATSERANADFSMTRPSSQDTLAALLHRRVIGCIGSLLNALLRD
jgi:hypothetical protein